MAPLAHAGDRRQRRPGDHGRDAVQDPENLWSIKTGRMQEAPAGPAARRGRELEHVRAVARTSDKPESRWSHCVWSTKSCEWMRASLDGLSFDGSTLAGNQMPAQPARSRISTARSDPFPVLRAVTASTGGLPSRTGPLLVLPRKRRNPDRNPPRPGIRQAAGRGRGRLLAAGEGRPLARTGQRRTGFECRSKMASHRASLP